MQAQPPFAYSLSQVEEGWRWSVYDEDGVTVARGADASRDTSRSTRSRLPAPAQATTGTPCSRNRPSTFSRSMRHSRVASGVH